ncbi:hypothetical protein ACOSOMT5_P1169 [Acidiphilium sp. MT5]
MKIEINAEGYHPVTITLSPIDAKLPDVEAEPDNESCEDQAETLAAGGAQIAAPAIGGKQFAFCMLGETHTAINETDRFVKILRFLAELAPEKLPALSDLLLGSKRRTIASSPSLVYLKKRQYGRAHKIAAGWYVDTNMDSARKRSLLKKISDFLGLEFGRDILLF